MPKSVALPGADVRIAFGIVSLFPGGGLQRDCIDIAQKVRNYGHDVVIHAARLNGAVSLPDIPIIVIPNTERTNHARQHRFALDFMQRTAGSFDLVVGFDKLIGLDVLYCADRSIYYRLLRQPYLGFLARYRTFVGIEGNTFKPGQKTRVILLGQRQRMEFLDAWHTEAERVIELPPTLSPARRRPQCRVNGDRERMRAQLGLPRDAWVWLVIGVQPKTKGFDRVLSALKHFPNAFLLIAGLNDVDASSKKMVDLVRRLDVASRVIWLGHREEIEQFAAASDVLMHPARYDTTGAVILEALVNGLPVITTSACGYAQHVRGAGAGIVLDEPFDFQLFLTAIKEMSDPARRAEYSEAGILYGSVQSLYAGKDVAAQLIINLAERRQADGDDVRDSWRLPISSEPSGNIVSLPMPHRK